ncbi:MAG TPA: phosphatidate cytidylyltransferase [Polyangia bacterium]
MAERNLLLRVASALVGLPVLFAIVFWREHVGFALLALVVGTIGLHEFGQLTLGQHPARARVVLIALGVGFGTAIYLQPDRAHLWALVAILLLGLDVLSSARDLPLATARLGMSIFGIVYVGALLVALPLLRRDYGAWWVMVVFVVTFANDTGAYFTGRALGRHKLAPTISPGKTIEGAVGGLLIGIVALLVQRAFFFPSLTIFDAVVVGTAAGVLGPAGDLTESMLKRAVGAKDSGRLIPGHGGVLDRIDALLFVGAYVFLHTRLFR